MCGIAGIFSSKEKVEKAWIASMAAEMIHRGPDDEGYLAVELKDARVYALGGGETKTPLPNIGDFQKTANLFLGHRRLAIIDLSDAGHQPMANGDASLWITYNGEIYNYLELRDELSGLGYVFKSHTDTEVILAAYECWGEECVDRFNGMWAFVIYDSRRHILFGARDRFGVKPFYYYRDTQYFAFASEVKALLCLPFIERRMNRETAFDYLCLRLDDLSEETFFKNIFELPAAHYFELDLMTGQFQKKRYFDLAVAQGWEDIRCAKMDKYIDEVREAVCNAVRLRLRSDVRVGTCLSGGIDSSSIVCVISQLLKNTDIPSIGRMQNTFTACYQHLTVDESRWAKIVIDASGAAWHRVYPQAKELLEDLEDMVYAQDLPFGSTSIYAQYRVMRLARESGVKVLLDGQGGDELFGGYTTYYRAFFAEMLKNFRLGRLNKEFFSLGNSPIHFGDLTLSLLRMYAGKLLPDRVRSVLRQDVIRRGVQTDFFDKHSHRTDFLQELFFLSLNENLLSFMGINLKTLLRYEDRNSMRFSIEARTPFADDIHLIQKVFGIPSSYKIYDGWSKYLLRMAMAGTLPEEIRWRKDKIGFATPECDWLYSVKDALRPYITDDLNEYIDVRSVSARWEEFLRNQKRTGITDIWRIINFAIWKKVFKVSL